MKIYDELSSWYRLLDPPDDHLAEATSYRDALVAAIQGSKATLLELGSGAGHNAVHLKKQFSCTLTDLSEPMLALGRELVPRAEHLRADMRDLRLNKTFDAVLVHDAIMYMTTEADLARAIETAFVHTRPGGAAVFAPDGVKDDFVERRSLLEGHDETRALSAIEWKWDPDPADDTVVVDYAFLLRENGEMRTVHDRHLEGLFARATWRRLLVNAGYRVETFARPLDDEGAFDDVFICRRPQA